MERTKRFFPPDDTPKPLKRQGFSDSRFQNATSFSSQARYDHFDTLPYNNYSVFGTDNMISSQPRYDHFDTAAYSIFTGAASKKCDFEGFRISPVMTTSIPPHGSFRIPDIRKKIKSFRQSF